MQRILTALIGNRDKLPLQHRILNLAGILGFLAFFQATIIDGIYHKNFIVAGISCLMSALFLGLYFVTRKLALYQWPVYFILLLTLCGAVPVLWWQNNGLHGSIPFWIVYLSGVISVLLTGWKKLLFIGLAIGMFLVLTVLDSLEITHSQMPYSRLAITIDVSSQIIIVMILTVLLISVLVQEYVYEQKKVEELANIDYVSGLYTRRYLLDQCDREIKRSMRTHRPFSLLLCDVDDFKKINDEHGHAAGDFAIQHIAQLFWRHIRSSDVAARWGGEEFLILFPETDIETALEIAERLHEATHTEPCIYKGTTIPFTFSFGISTYTDYTGHTPIEHCIKSADDALYQSKKAGKDQITRGSCPSQATKDQPSVPA